MTTATPAVHLVDGSLYVFRAWHSMPDQFHDADGHPVNAVHGFTRFLCELLEKSRAEHVAVAFDASLTSSFRNAIYPPTRPTANCRRRTWSASSYSAARSPRRSASRC
jgi:5'-3' exonuclease